MRICVENLKVKIIQVLLTNYVVYLFLFFKNEV